MNTIIINDLEAMKAKKKNQMRVEKINYNTVLVMVMKKEWIWIMRRISHRKTQKKITNQFSSQSEIDQIGHQQV